MPLEIEIKLRVDSHEVVRTALCRAKAKRVGKVLETNAFFDYADRRLLKRNAGLRVRTVRPVTSRRGEPASALLTYKGPPRKTGLRSREAFDLTVVPAEQIVPLLKSLGLVQTLCYEKLRESWLCGGCQVELDEVPHLGRFVEIEGPSEARVRGVQKRLGLAALAAVRPSYIHMLDEYLKRHKIKARTIRIRP